MSKPKIAGIAAGVVLLVGVLSWMFTAPYLGNQGLSRMPGVIIGGTDTPAPSDFTPLNDIQGPLLMKQSGFPPLVVYLSYVGTPDGVITATRPDGGYWAQRVRDRGGDGWLRIGDTTYAMEATEVLGNARAHTHARAVFGQRGHANGQGSRWAGTAPRVGGLLLDA